MHMFFILASSSFNWEKLMKRKPSLLTHFIPDYRRKRTGVWELYIIAQGQLSEFVIEPSVYSTMKPVCRNEMLG